tara:strand:+ start:211 stop:393 length:183 start_codon:yes stop_codon:yes gene_type:complete
MNELRDKINELRNILISDDSNYQIEKDDYFRTTIGKLSEENEYLKSQIEELKIKYESESK